MHSKVCHDSTSAHSVLNDVDWETDSICYNNSQIVQRGFKRFKKEYAFSIQQNKTSYQIIVDYPNSNIPFASVIQTWIMEQIGKSVRDDKRIHYRRKGYKYSIEDIAEQTAEFYYKQQKKDHDGLINCSSTLKKVFNFRLVDNNKRMVTFQQCSYSYEGCTHGYNTEQIVSFDKQHNELITNEYLFRRKCLNDIKQLILETALRDEKLSRWETIDSMNDVKEHFMGKDDDGNMIDSLEKMYLPQPGLSKDCLVYSFQPYDISYFAAECYHFVVPYRKLLPFLSKKGQWCLENK